MFVLGHLNRPPLQGLSIYEKEVSIHFACTVGLWPGDSCENGTGINFTDIWCVKLVCG